MNNKTAKQRKLQIGEKYYTCSYTGVERVSIIKIFDDNEHVLVKADKEGNKAKPFVRHIKYIFNSDNKAKNAMKD